MAHLKVSVTLANTVSASHTGNIQASRFLTNMNRTGKLNLLVIHMRLISFVKVCFPKILYIRKEVALWPLAEQNSH